MSLRSIAFYQLINNIICSFPDVMMQSFSQNKWYAIYFVSYLCTMLYVMMNLMLAVVNETFTSRERDKFKKLFLHKRKACQHAFKLLVSKQNPDKMRFRQFEGLMRYYAPNKCMYMNLFYNFSDKISPAANRSVERSMHAQLS